MGAVQEEPVMCCRTASGTMDLMNIRRHINSWRDVGQRAMHAVRQRRLRGVQCGAGFGGTRLTLQCTALEGTADNPVSTMAGEREGKEMGHRQTGSLQCWCLTDQQVLPA